MAKRSWKIQVLAIVTVAAAAAGLLIARAEASAPPLALYASLSDNRTNGVPLTGATVSGNAYVFLRSEALIRQVSFRINDEIPNKYFRVDDTAPFDLAGTAPDGSALPIDTRSLPNGDHMVFASVQLADGRSIEISSPLTIDNRPVDEPAAEPAPPAPPVSTVGTDTTGTTVAPPAGVPVAAPVTTNRRPSARPAGSPARAPMVERGSVIPGRPSADATTNRTFLTYRHTVAPTGEQAAGQRAIALDGYRQGHSVHVILAPEVGTKAVVQTPYGTGCGSAHLLEPAFLEEVRRTAAVYAGGPLYLTIFTDVSAYACTDGRWAGSDNYHRALNDVYLEALSIVRSVAPGAKVALGWELTDVTVRDGRLALAHAFEKSLRASDYSALIVNVPSAEDLGRRLIAAVPAVRDYPGEVFLFLTGPGNDARGRSAVLAEALKSDGVAFAGQGAVVVDIGGS